MIRGGGRGHQFEVGDHDITSVVIDANLILRSFRSKNGASHAILRSVLVGELEYAASPAIILEYEDVLKRPGILG